MTDEIKIAYLCDKKACNPCSNGECQHTLDVNHAVSFIELAPGRWIEKENVLQTEDNKMTKTKFPLIPFSGSKQKFTPGDQVFSSVENIRGTVRAVYTAMDWGEVIDVVSDEGPIIYASPSKKWKVRKI